MYTFEDIRDIAVQIEKNGERTYRKAGENVINEELARILIWLADEELRHKMWFKALVSHRKITSGHSEMEAMGRALLRDMVKEQPFCLDAEHLGSAAGVSELLTQSVGFEKDTILFYDMLKTLVEDDRAIVHLDQIIEEERGHVKVLERLQAKFVKGLDVDLSRL
jgi:rubrerythrin